MSRKEFTKRNVYTEIVDEQSHALSEAFDLPVDMEHLQQELTKAGPRGIAIRLRPVTKNESKAFGICDPELMLAGAKRKLGKRPFSRSGVDTSNDLTDDSLSSECDDQVNEFETDKDILGDRDSFGVRIANYIRACKSNQRCEFNDDCRDTKELLNDGAFIPSVVRYIIQASLLDSTIDLGIVADEIDRAMKPAPYFFDKRLFRIIVANNVAIVYEIARLICKIGLPVDRDEVVRWIKFCGIRSTRFDIPGSSRQYSNLHEPVFSRIDKAVEEIPFLAALVNGPSDWAVPTVEN